MFTYFWILLVLRPTFCLGFNEKSECVNYKDKDGVYQNIFACYVDSLQDLMFTCYDMNLEDENIVSILDSIELSDLSLYRQFGFLPNRITKPSFIRSYFL